MVLVEKISWHLIWELLTVVFHRCVTRACRQSLEAAWRWRGSRTTSSWERLGLVSGAWNQRVGWDSVRISDYDTLRYEDRVRPWQHSHSATGVTR